MYIVLLVLHYYNEGVCQKIKNRHWQLAKVQQNTVALLLLDPPQQHYNNCWRYYM